MRDWTRVGSFCWVSAIQFFVVQIIVQAAWTTPFSLSSNFISDLGNTSCAPYPPGSAIYVCSPWHGLMNASFLALGLAKIAGAVLIRGTWPLSRFTRIGLGLMIVSGLGTLLVAWYPENVNADWHRIGAGLDLVAGNLGIAFIGAAILRSGRLTWFGIYSVLSGGIGLSTLYLFISGRYLGLGIGGMERLAAYPIPFWMIAGGLIMRYPQRNGTKT